MQKFKTFSLSLIKKKAMAKKQVVTKPKSNESTKSESEKNKK